MNLGRLNGDATWWCELGGVRVVFDPWLVGSEVDYARWFNEAWHTDPVVPPAEAGDIGLIVVSQHYADHLHPATLLLEPGHHAVCGGEAVGAAPGEHDRVDLPNTLGGTEQVGLAGAGRAAADVDSTDGARGCQDDGAAARPPRTQGRIRVQAVVVADQDAVDVGDRARVHRMGLPIKPRTRYSCSTVSHW